LIYRIAKDGIDPYIYIPAELIYTSTKGNSVPFKVLRKITHSNRLTKLRKKRGTASGKNI
jgi:hypothetical protein